MAFDIEALLGEEGVAALRRMDYLIMNDPDYGTDLPNLDEAGMARFHGYIDAAYAAFPEELRELMHQSADLQRKMGLEIKAAKSATEFN